MAQIADLKSELVGMEQNANVVVYSNQTATEVSQEGVGEGNYVDYTRPEVPPPNVDSNVFAYEKVPD